MTGPADPADAQGGSAAPGVPPPGCAQPAAARTQVPHRRPVPPVMAIWWLTWIASLVLARASGALTAGDTSIKALRESVEFGLAAEVATVVAAVACAWIVPGLGARVLAGGYRAN